MKVILKAKGPGKGWWGPPRGDHVPRKRGQKKRDGTEKTLRGKAPKGSSGEKVADEAADRVLQEGSLGAGGDYFTATGKERAAVKAMIQERLVDDITGMTKAEMNNIDDDAKYDMTEIKRRAVEHDVYHTMGGWAETSNDNDMRALGLQQAAAQEFGVPVSTFTQGKIDSLSNLRQLAIKDYAQTNHLSLDRAEQVMGSHPMWRPLQTKGTTQGTVLRTMYDQTQETLKAQGVKEVTLFRGITHKQMYDDFVNTGNPVVGILGNTLESWSTDFAVSNEFATEKRASVVLRMTVPREMIVSTAATGLGCLTEGEYVLLGSVPGSQARIVEAY